MNNEIAKRQFHNFQHHNHKFLSATPRTMREAFPYSGEPEAYFSDKLVFWVVVIGAAAALILLGAK